jgi:hypothetical protein
MRRVEKTLNLRSARHVDVRQTILEHKKTRHAACRTSRDYPRAMTASIFSCRPELSEEAYIAVRSTTHRKVNGVTNGADVGEVCQSECTSVGNLRSYT